MASKITFIGAGNMAGAIIGGLIDSGDGGANVLQVRRLQQPRFGLALDHDLAAENLRGLTLEIRAIGGPVDEIRCEQRAEQRENEKSAEEDEGSDQYGLLFLLFLKMPGRQARQWPPPLVRR